ncbi:DNA-binding HxlR family transcriptional regulator [Streptosporangium album]|uniref:DNA-binding HxlR family transcriptional regulator n=1 Tax=Streptosporangium album TaxID=47479 RepID=A0A7W7RYN5_9ACTN|nr:helix-turn-helix domain-containing protein [Streptosporangium album]MBB4939998.1 DNA-binding HxlR family transcriptional regulator [Streptosporangium album]
MCSEGEDVPEYCMIEVAMEVVGGKWKLAILKNLFPGPQRFSELRRAMPGVTQRMLTRQLRELEADELVVRTVYPQVPPKVEYALTEIGRSLEEIADRLDRWGRWYRRTARRPATSGTGQEASPAGP